MTEHVCRWMVGSVGGVYLAICNAGDGDCGAELSAEEIDRRLNATGRLSKSKADTAASLIRGHTVKDDLKAYVRELEDE